MPQHRRKPLKNFVVQSLYHHNQSKGIADYSASQTCWSDYSGQKLVGCVVGLLIYPSETPRLSSEASPRVI